jgi:homoserine kinase
VPVSRGLGSSATLLAAGALAANILHENALPAEKIFAICNRLEGHPDNVAPALYGGLCLSLLDGDTPITVKYPVSEKLFFTAVIPNFEVSTHDARGALPKEVPFGDAVFNLSRAALLSHAFTSGDGNLISLVTKDALHEKYRKKLFRNVCDVEKAAYEEGALTFIISGAGSTCLCISEKPLANALNSRISALPNDWHAIDLCIDHEGAKAI